MDMSELIDRIEAIEEEGVRLMLQMPKRDKCLLDLPVLHNHRDDAGTSHIVDSFVKERVAISSADELRAFTERWRNAWLLEDRVHRSTTERLLSEEARIVFGLFNCDEILAAIPTISTADSISAGGTLTRPQRIAAHICIPLPMLSANKLSNQYGCGLDLAMVRLYLDPWEEHQDKLR